MDPSPATVFAEGCSRGELLYTVGADGRPGWPPQVGLEWRRSGGVGRVYATTTVHRRDEEPRNLSLIELDEGFRMMSRVESPRPVEIEQRVRVTFDADGLPLFVPA